MDESESAHVNRGGEKRALFACKYFRVTVTRFEWSAKICYNAQEWLNKNPTNCPSSHSPTVLHAHTWRKRFDNSIRTGNDVKRSDDDTSYWFGGFVFALINQSTDRMWKCFHHHHSVASTYKPVRSSGGTDPHYLVRVHRPARAAACTPRSWPANRRARSSWSWH